MERLRYADFILVDEQGRFLLQHRTDDAPIHPGIWGFFGGGIENGESPEQAVAREAGEELGIGCSFRLVGHYEINEMGRVIDTHMFIAPVGMDVEELRKRQMEGNDLGVFSYKEFLGLETSADVRNVLRDLFNRKIIK